MNHKRDNARLLCTNVTMIFCFSETQPTQKKSKKEQKKKDPHSLRQKKTDRDREQPFHKKKRKQTNVFFCRCFFSADDGSRRDDENYNRFTFKRTRRRR